MTDSLARLTCYDAISAGKVDLAIAAPAAASASPIALVKSRLSLQEKDFQLSVFNPRIELRLSFNNSSEKAVVALAHTLVVRDAFGDTIVSQNGKLDITIPPHKTAESQSFYYWEDNPFIPDQPFDNMIGPVNERTATVEIKVTKVVFKDGTIETFE